MGQHLLSTKDLNVHDLNEILERARYFEKLNDLSRIQDNYCQHFVANLFMEPSTRTRFSFEVAEKKLGLQVLNFQSEASSLKKGESLYDTLRTLESMGVEAAVIRLKEENKLQELKDKLKIKIVNAGEGTVEHPTQALLDIYTIKKYFGENLKGLNVAIIGDIAHSRVARSNVHLLSKLGANLIFSGPKNLIAEDLDGKYLLMDEAIKAADVVMMLRIQFERQMTELISSKEDYNKEFGFTEGRLNLLQPQAIILHPAPVNRGVEMDDCVVEHPKSKIFEQIKNGVWIRMAVIERAIGGKANWVSSLNKEQYGTKTIGL